MKIDLSYSDETITLDLPSSVTVDTYSPETIENPLGFGDFHKGFAEAGGDQLLTGEPPLITVNDGYRNTPTATILQWLDRIDSKVIDKAHFLIATGIHPAPTEEHIHKIFGAYIHRVREHVTCHDCHDRSSMILLGTDNLSGEVWLNSAVLNHKKIMAIGSVEPHYFAGFTGGRKSVFPGLTDFDTVVRNHNLANSLKAAPLKLKGNPVAEHLNALTAMLDGRSIFGIQIVTDAKQQVAGLFFGSLDESFQKAQSLAEEIYSHRVSQSYDAVLCEVLPPLDGNLYQSQKALENCQAAVRDSGAIIVISACREGIGSRYFFDLAANWDRQANRATDGLQHFGSHKLSRVVSIGRRISVHLHSTVPDEDVRRVFFEPLDNLQTFLYSTAEECEKYHLAVVRDAANVVLRT